MRWVVPAQLRSRRAGFRAEMAIQVAAVGIGAIALVIVLLIDQTPLTTGAFAVSTILFVIATALAFVLGRSDTDWLFLVPALDMVALIVLRQVPQDHVHAIGYLAILPALWLGWSGRKAFTGLAVVLSLALVELPRPGGEDVFDLEHALTNLLIPAVVAVSAATTFVASRQTTASIRSLVEQEKATADALARERQTSELLDGMLDAVDVGIVAYDADGRQLLANRAVLSHPVIVSNDVTALELDRRGSMLQSDRATPFEPGTAVISRALDGDEYSNQVVWVSTAAGRQHAIAASARPLLEEGRFAGTIIALDDVTAYLETIAAKDAFVSSVSHEFRTPLASLVGYLELVLDESERLPDDVRQHLEVMERNGVRLQAIVNELVGTASSFKGAIRLPRELTDIVALCQSVIDRLGVAAKKADVRIDFAAAEPVAAVINARRLRQAIENVVATAVELSPGGQVVMAVSSDGERVTITVRDPDVTISSEELDALTSPFFDATSAPEHFPGIGLGISMAKVILGEHWGSLDFESEAATGTTVTMAFAVR